MSHPQNVTRKAPLLSILGRGARAPRPRDGAGSSPWFGLARAAVVAVFVYLSWYQSLDFSNVLVMGMIWAVAGVGLALVLGMAGQMLLCQASFMLIGAYLYGWLARDQSVPTVIALLAGGVGGMLAAAVLSPVLRLKGFTFALGTIALGLLVTQIFRTASWLPGGNLGLTDVPYVNLGFVTLETSQQYLWATAVLLAVVVLALHRAFGHGARSRAIQFVHHDEDLLAFFGGNSVRLKRVLFMVAALLAGISGGIYAAAFGFVTPGALGINESFALALAVVLGGNGRLLGAVLGALIYQMSFTVLGENGAEFRFALLGGIVIVMIHFFPNGLLPARQEFQRWLPILARRPHRAAEQLPPDDDGPALGIELDGVTKRFGALTAVGDLTATVRPGSLVALIGPNGAGKSTLLDAIAGSALSGGAIRIGGRDVSMVGTSSRARMRVARTFQRVRLIPSLSVLENVLVGADQWALSTSGRQAEPERVAVAQHALAEVGLAARETSSIAELSFGEERLVELARVIASRPRLVLLDEPSSGLNDSEVEAFAQMVRRLHAGGCTVVLVEHNLPLVQSLASDVIAMDRGRLLAQGPTAEVFALAAFQEAYVGTVAVA